MRLQWLPPASDLRHIIQVHWTMEWPPDTPETLLRIISDAHPELLYHSGSVPQRTFFGSHTPFRTTTCATGIFRRHVQIHLKGPVRMFLVKLQPWALTPLLRIQGQELIDRQPALSDLSNDCGPPVQEMLDEGQPIEAIAQELEHWIRRQALRWTIDPALEGAVAWINNWKGSRPVGELQGKFMIGRRRLEQLFRENIGLSPKAFAKLVRIRQVCQRMLRQPDEPLSYLAADFGYTDQSHLSRDFKHYLDTTPRRYRTSLKGKPSLYH